jgi:hypothetical protein
LRAQGRRPRSGRPNRPGTGHRPRGIDLLLDPGGATVFQPAGQQRVPPRGRRSPRGAVPHHTANPGPGLVHRARTGRRANRTRCVRGRRHCPRLGSTPSTRHRHVLPTRGQGAEDLLVDLALDAPPNLPAVASTAGPTFGLEELAGRKTIALFDRAEARDFADVYILAQRYTKPLLLTRAAEVDSGFDLTIFADMLDTLSRFTDAEIPIEPAEVNVLREFFAQWATELRT